MNEGSAGEFSPEDFMGPNGEQSADFSATLEDDKPPLDPREIDWQARIQEKALQLLSADAPGEDLSELQDKLDGLHTYDVGEYERIMHLAASHANLEFNLDTAEAEYKERYDTKLQDKVRNWFEKRPGLKRLAHAATGMAAGGTVRAIATGIAGGVGSVLAVGAFPLSLAGGALGAGAAGAVTGYLRGKQKFAEKHLSRTTLEEDLNIESHRLIEEGERLEKTLDPHKAETKELFENYFNEVNEALTKYKEIERQKLLGDSPAEIRHFYENKARLQHILEARDIRNEHSEALSEEERADALIRAIDRGKQADENSYNILLREDTREFLEKKLSEQKKFARRTALKSGLIAGGVGFITAGLLSHFTDAYAGNDWSSAGGGHWNPEMAQQHALQNEDFRQFIENIKDVDPTDNTQVMQLIDQGYDFKLGAGPEDIKNIHQILQTAADKNLDVGKLGYNLLSYMNHGNDEQMYLDAFKYPEKFTDPAEFHQISYIQSFYKNYSHKLANIIPVASTVGRSFIAAATDTLPGLLTGVAAPDRIAKQQTRHYVPPQAEIHDALPTGETEVQPELESTFEPFEPPARPPKTFAPPPPIPEAHEGHTPEIFSDEDEESPRKVENRFNDDINRVIDQGMSKIPYTVAMPFPTRKRKGLVIGLADSMSLELEPFQQKLPDDIFKLATTVVDELTTPFDERQDALSQLKDKIQTYAANPPASPAPVEPAPAPKEASVPEPSIGLREISALDPRLDVEGHYITYNGFDIEPPEGEDRPLYWDLLRDIENKDLDDFNEHYHIHLSPEPDPTTNTYKIQFSGKPNIEEES